MTYTPTIFVDKVTPLNAEVLNKSEVQLKVVSDLAVNPVGQVAQFDTVKALNDMHVGKRGPIGPPNFNNLYVSGSIYTGPKEEVPVITGPGAQGGNIYMPHTKAICGLTKEGPIAANPELGIAADSGVRTIAFAGRVFQEDIDNEETSIYLGTNVSRMYFYSRTAYPTIVSNRPVAGIGALPTATDEPDLTIQTVSPVATQEWVVDLLGVVGIVGGEEDTTIYTVAPTNANQAFSLSETNNWTNKEADWVLNTNGTIGSRKTSNKSFWVPLLQAQGWNDIYLTTPDMDIDFILAKTDGSNGFVYGITFAENSYKLYSLDRAGRRHFDYIYPNPNNIDPSGITRVRYDASNGAFVITSIKDSTETEIVSLSLANFAGFQEFSSAAPCIGFAYRINTSNSNIAKIVPKPTFRANMTYIPDTSKLNPYIKRFKAPKEEELEHYINSVVEQKVAEAMLKIKR